MCQFEKHTLKYVVCFGLLARLAVGNARPVSRDQTLEAGAGRMLPCRGLHLETLTRPVSRDQTCGSGPLLLARFEDKSQERGFGTGTVSPDVRGGEEAV